MGLDNATRLHSTHLACETALVGPLLTLKFTGSGEGTDVDLVSDELSKAHLLAVESSVAKVLVDFEGVNFLNAACFKLFATWSGKVAALPRNRYRIHFKLSPKRKWQRASVSALCCFAVEVISFE